MTRSIAALPLPKTTRLLLTLTTFVTLAPLLIFLGMCVNAPRFVPHVIAIGAFLLIALVLLQGCLRVLAVLVGIAAFGVLAYLASGTNQWAVTPAHTYLVLGAKMPTAGVDVYCNGVHLGKTPLRISRTEFDAKVPWLQSPPRQERLDIRDRQFKDVKYSQIPQDVSEQDWAGGRGWTKEFRPQAGSPPDFLKTSQHWWHFDADGHSGLGRLLEFGVGVLTRRGHYFSGGYHEVEADADIDYPALGPHLDAMVEALRRTGYRPDDAWIAHFLKDQSLFFLEFRKRALAKPRLMPALEAAVRAEFSLPEKPTAADCARVLDAIIVRTEARRGFLTPSMESMALDMMGEQATGALVSRFRQEVSLPLQSYSPSVGAGWRIETRAGRAARMLPLEYLAAQLHPEALFPLLVYECSRSGRFLSLVAGYENKPAARILTERLRGAAGIGHDAFDVYRLMSDLPSIRSPQVEEQMRNFVRYNATDRFNASRVQAFVESRIGDPTIDQAELATWVFHWAPLKERDRIDLTLRIDGALTYHYLQMLGVSQDQSKRENAIGFLAQNPNASLDQFIIDTYHWYDGAEGPGYWSTSVSEALARTDTPAIRDFIRTTLAAGGEGARKLVGRLNDAPGDLSALAWMTDLFRDLTDPRTRADAAGILARVDTPAARQLLDAWAADADAGVARAAAQALDAHRERQALADLRFRQYGELLSGKIRPDDLLPPAQPCVWNGEAYVPEHPEADGN